MTERSYVWDGTTLGDATIAPYSSFEFTTTYIGFLAAQSIKSPFNRAFASLHGVGETTLLVTGTASPVSVAVGAAGIDGAVYHNDASLGIAIPTPASNPRIDRIIIRKTAATQVIRAVRLAGTEAAAPTAPALTQTAAVWEVWLAQVEISTGGVIKVRDERLAHVGLADNVLFRDIHKRVCEEFFDNFVNASIVSGQIGNTGWTSVLTGTGLVGLSAPAPSNIVLTSGATAGGVVNLNHGAQYPHQLQFDPLLFEWKAAPINTIDGQAIAQGRFLDAGGTNSIQFGVYGPSSSVNYVARGVVAGVATAVVTSIPVDLSGGYHKFGIWIPLQGGPAVFLYDDLPIAAIPAANLPAVTTDMRAEFAVGNGTTAASRVMALDWARVVRGDE